MPRYEIEPNRRWRLPAARISLIVILLLALLGAPPAASYTIETAWPDAVFHRPLSFYLFDLPFYMLLRSYLLALVIVCILLYWLVARAWQLRYKIPELNEVRELDASFFRLEGGLESRFLRGAAAV